MACLSPGTGAPQPRPVIQSLPAHHSDFTAGPFSVRVTSVPRKAGKRSRERRFLPYLYRIFFLFGLLEPRNPRAAAPQPRPVIQSLPAHYSDFTVGPFSGRVTSVPRKASERSRERRFNPCLYRISFLFGLLEPRNRRTAAKTCDPITGGSPFRVCCRAFFCSSDQCATHKASERSRERRFNPCLYRISLLFGLLEPRNRQGRSQDL